MVNLTVVTSFPFWHAQHLSESISTFGHFLVSNEMGVATPLCDTWPRAVFTKLHQGKFHISPLPFLQASLPIMALFSMLSFANCFTTGSSFLFSIFVKFRRVCGDALNITIVLWPRPISLNVRRPMTALALTSYDGLVCEIWKQYLHSHSMLSHCRTM